MTLRCPKGHDNPDNFQFCGECGAPLSPPGMVLCSRGHENVSGQGFCGECGEPLGTSGGTPTIGDASGATPATAPVSPAGRVAGERGQAAPSSTAVVARRGNGLAVAALVLGIIGVLSGLIPLLFFFAWVLGVLAFVFGWLGRGAVKRDPSRSGRGQATAGVILGALACVLGVVGIVIVVGVFSSVDRALREAAGPAPASSYRLAEGSCAVDSVGFARHQGTITNTSDRSRNYMIKVEFLDPSGTRLGQGSKVVTGLGAGQTGQWEAIDSVPGTATVQCRVLGVDNFFNSPESKSHARSSTESTLGTVPNQPGVAASPIVKVGSDKILVTAAGTSATVAKANTKPPRPLAQIVLTFDVDAQTPIQTTNIKTGRYRGRYFLVTALGGDTRVGALIGQRNRQWTLIPVQTRGVPSLLTEGLAFGGQTGFQAVQRDCVPNCAAGNDVTVALDFSADGTLVPSSSGLGADPAVRFDGIGPVKIGMATEQAAQAVGMPLDAAIRGRCVRDRNAHWRPRRSFLPDC